MVVFSTRTDIGLRRSTNEDNMAAVPELGLWIVADGMGGHEQGEIASRLAVETLQERIRAGQTLEVGIRATNDIIARQPAVNPAFSMGTTVVAVLIEDYHYRIAWVGDSRAYLWNGELKQLTTDHSYVQGLVEAGKLNSADRRTHPRRSALTQALGVTDTCELRIGVVEGELLPGNGLLLCTDGLTGELTDEEIADCLTQTTDPESIAQKLLDNALSAGGKDNVTLIWLLVKPGTP